MEPNITREFAIKVVTQLREAGHESLWAGGCVRDELLGRRPKDFDVATSATPDQVRDVFGHRRTLAIGAAFGVITVLGGRKADQVEVATFRQDAKYSDGRHPDHVTYSNAKEDASRRDFTINGLFYDPLADKVIDYVDGQSDLREGVVRAIGDPQERFDEDKLRMLRAVRFAATFDFRLDTGTLSAIQQRADEIRVVSAERIAAELRRMLAHENRARACELLEQSGLLTVILPESAALQPPDGELWRQTVRIINGLKNAPFVVALASLLRDVDRVNSVETICRRWKLSNEETNTTAWLLDQEQTIRTAGTIAWPALQRLLTTPEIGLLLDFVDAVSTELDGGNDEVEFCREKLRLPENELNPARLITGDDLIAHGIRPGKAFKDLLEAVRDAQLEKRVSTKAEGLELAARILGAREK